MALTDEQIRVLNNLSNYLPELGKPSGVPNIPLGDILASVEAGSNALVALGAVATADAEVTAVSNASDATTAAALANDLKAKWNAAVPLINELKTRLNTLAAITG